jgi:nitroreductase
MDRIYAINGLKPSRAKNFKNIFGKAPVLIAIFGDVSFPCYIYDCCAATQNLILSAHRFGLGSCWIEPGIGDELTESQIRNLLNAPKNLKIVSLVAVGFPAEMPKPKSRKDIEAISFLNQYGKKWNPNPGKNRGN